MSASNEDHRIRTESIPMFLRNTPEMTHCSYALLDLQDARQRESELEAEPAAAKADAKMLDYLQETIDRAQQAENNGCCTVTIQIFNMATVRQAIAAAIAAQRQKEGE